MDMLSLHELSCLPSLLLFFRGSRGSAIVPGIRIACCIMILPSVLLLLLLLSLIWENDGSIIKPSASHQDKKLSMALAGSAGFYNLHRSHVMLITRSLVDG